jgi:hypothetical protein
MVEQVDRKEKKRKETEKKYTHLFARPGLMHHLTPDQILLFQICQTKRFQRKKEGGRQNAL